MRFTNVILSAVLCLAVNAGAVEKAADQKDERSTEAIEAAAQQLISESASTESGFVSASVEAPKAEPKESEIPIVMTPTKEAKGEANVAWRLLASLGILAVVAVGMVFVGKRWTKQKDKGGQKARIEILHQYHLGPRKSLALIRVSGEAMLVGVTDQNINMLKTVTLIDDELENVLGKDFNNFLEDEFSIEDVRNAIAPRV